MAAVFVRCSLRDLYWRASQDFLKLLAAPRCRRAGGHSLSTDRRSAMGLAITPLLSRTLD
jgi:hypothetical protein